MRGHPAPLALSTVARAASLIACVACSGPPDLVMAPGPAPRATVAPTAEARSARPVPRADATLPPRAVFFGDPEKTSVTISPDGKRLAYLAPREGVLNLWVAPTSAPERATPVTNERGRGVRSYVWTYTGQLVFLQDQGGDESFRAYVVSLEGAAPKGPPVDLTPLKGTPGRATRVELVALSPKRPRELLLTLNDRDARHPDLYRVDLATQKRTLVERNDDGRTFVVDHDLTVRFVRRVLPTGGLEYSRLGAKGLEPVLTAGPEDVLGTRVLGFDRAGREAYVLDSRGRDTSALVACDPRTLAPRRVLAEDATSDVESVHLDPREGAPLAASTNRLRVAWRALGVGVDKDLAGLSKVDSGDLAITSSTQDGATWTVAFARDDGPARHYLWDRKGARATFLFAERTLPEGLSASRMHPITLRARDGLELPSYLTMPRGLDVDGDGKPERRGALVLVVHGGPWTRDRWGFSPVHQWLASRGYAVLSANFRGSTGLGKRFVSAADREWAGKMHDDLVDVTAWAVQEGIAEQDRLAIYGASYGGYAALVGLTVTPKHFACAVDLVGPSSLVTLLENAPPHWTSFGPMLAQKVGDWKTDTGRKELWSRSPLGMVDRIERPLLVGHGANDPRVGRAESDLIVSAMVDKGIPVTYALYPDEGHGLGRPENRVSFAAVAESLLASCLGGAYLPIGDDLRGSSLTVPAGAEHVHGLEAALRAAAAR